MYSLKRYILINIKLNTYPCRWMESTLFFSFIVFRTIPWVGENQGVCGSPGEPIYPTFFLSYAMYEVIAR